MAIKSEHIITAELADWQTPVKDKDLTTSPSPSNGDKYIIAGTGGSWSPGTINDIVWYIDSAWFFITPAEGMQVYVEDENVYYFFNGSVWGTMGGSGDMTKAVYDTNANNIVDKAESIDDGSGNTASATEIVKSFYNIVLLAFKLAYQASLTVFNMIDGFVDEYENESGIDTSASTNEIYDATDDYYRPSGGTMAYSPYAHFKCNDDAANTVATDDGTGANNGVASTNTSNLSVAGKINEAFDFNGSSEYINIDALQQDIETDTTGSISFWVNPDIISGVQFLFALTDASAANDYFYFRISSTGYVRIVLLAGGTTKWAWLSSTALTAGGGWYHITLVQNGTAPVLYINGSSDGALYESSDTTAWFNNLNAANIDTGRIACWSYNGAGNSGFFDGQIDDFRYYQNIALTQSDINALYNSGSGTEDDTPIAASNNMTLISEKFTALADPDSSRIVILEEDVDAITLNTDLKAYASKDDGATWGQITLADEGDYDASKRVLVGNADLSVSGIGAGTDMVYKLTTHNEKGLRIHGTALSWD